MIFTASIRSGSPVDRTWRSHSRRSGALYGIPFLLSGGSYVTSELDAAQVTALAEHASVRLEACGALPETPALVPAGEAPTPPILTVGDALTRTLTPAVVPTTPKVVVKPPPRTKPAPKVQRPRK